MNTSKPQLKTIHKAFILAGGKGTRMSELTKETPKPLVDFIGLPMIIHIMRNLRQSGVTEFYVLGGYKFDNFVEYFRDNSKEVFLLNVIGEREQIWSFNLKDELLDDCQVNLIYTGKDKGTAQRLNHSLIRRLIGNQPFILTYGDGISDVDITKAEKVFLESPRPTLVITGIPYKERFGLMEVDSSGLVKSFKEKQESTTHFINGGYMCISPEIFNYISYDDFDFSRDVLEKPELSGKIKSTIHRGYWYAIDSVYDLKQAENELKEKGEL